jgi:hypothetical protein
VLFFSSFLFQTLYFLSPSLYLEKKVRGYRHGVSGLDSQAQLKQRFLKATYTFAGETQMIISDLNYLENTSEEILGGRGTNIDNFFRTNKIVNANVNETFNKTINTNLNGIQGNVAELVVSADATGNRTFTSVIGGVQTEDNRSETFVNAISATVRTPGT